MLAEVVGNAIISHHSYLKDFLNQELESNYLNRVRDKELAEFEKTKQSFFEHVITETKFFKYVDKAAEELERYLAKESVENWGRQLMFLT
ncbi:CRISPR-associated helicase/endonuclease Cas3, partial [Alkalihalophilus pseudofirmus]|nr:CRISPR-associated helicase/endonuclease Cas3 [Alkalihalophilus pseudofirmus]